MTIDSSTSFYTSAKISPRATTIAVIKATITNRVVEITILPYLLRATTGGNGSVVVRYPSDRRTDPAPRRLGLLRAGVETPTQNVVLPLLTPIITSFYR